MEQLLSTQWYASACPINTPTTHDLHSTNNMYNKQTKKTNVREDQREKRLFHSIRPSYDSDVVVDSVDI